MRKPSAAGYFYPAKKEDLRKQIEEMFISKLGVGKLAGKSENVVGLIVPHAGYVYSGYVAAHAYHSLSKKPKSFVIIGPNHAGYGASLSVYARGSWLTPLGEAKIDEQVASLILKKSKLASEDEIAHASEHSIEVQLPFLQCLFGKVSFVPICMLDQTITAARDLANALAELEQKVVFIASTDFSHYESQEVAREKDMLAVEAIRSLDVEKFYEVVRVNNVSMCGYGCVAVLMLLAKQVGCKIELIKYMTSGDVTGDRGAVVGYAALKAIKI